MESIIRHELEHGGPSGCLKQIAVTTGLSSVSACDELPPCMQRFCTAASTAETVLCVYTAPKSIR